MKSLRPTLFLFVAAMLTASAATGQDHDNLQDYSVKEDGAYTIIIEWVVRDAGLVHDFMLERSTSGNSTDFQNFNKSNCMQSGNRFRCEDSDLYKGSSEQTAATGSVSYRLKVTHPDGTPHVYFQTTVEYTTNAVRRTWGSIKSMFQ
jgi:hypothetical protein